MSAFDDLDVALAALETGFDDALERVTPNPYALRFSEIRFDFQAKRDLVFALGLLNEGENEAMLIAALARRELERDPSFDAAHLVREAWYYLRTSIDPAWQFDDVPPDFGAAIAYVRDLLRERVAAYRRPSGTPADAPDAAARRTRLDAIRSR